MTIYQNQPQKAKYIISNKACGKERNEFSTTSRRKIRKCVRFGSNVQTKSVPSVKREDLWYKREAYMSFRKELNHTVRAIHQYYRGDVRYLDPREHCLTGLEDRLTHEQVSYRRRKARHHTHTVLYQQYTQRCLGIYDPDFISDIAGVVSRSCGFRAQQIASSVIARH